MPTFTTSASSNSRPAIDKKKSILTEDCKKLEYTLAKLSSEASEFQSKLGEILNCVQTLYNRFQNLEQKVSSANVNYAAAAARPQNSEPSIAAQGRVEKLEYMVSEMKEKDASYRSLSPIPLSITMPLASLHTLKPSSVRR